jgi:hypothetical protein
MDNMGLSRIFEIFVEISECRKLCNVLKVRDQLGNLDADEKLILKWISEKLFLKWWNELVKSLVGTTVKTVLNFEFP